MLEFEILDGDGNRSQYSLEPGSYRLGKSDQCDVLLADAHVSRHHADLVISEGYALLKDANSTNGIWRDGEQMSVSEHLAAGDSFQMGGLMLSVLHFGEQTQADFTAGPPVTEVISSPPPPLDFPKAPPATRRPKEVGNITAFKRDVHGKLREYLDLHKRGEIHNLSSEKLRQEAKRGVEEVIEAARLVLPRGAPRQQLIDEIVAEAVGLGPIEPLLDDDSVSEIMVNGHDQIYVERGGKIELTSTRFSSNASLVSIIERIVTPLGRRIDEGSPTVDARLQDGSRVNAIIPPLSLQGPVLTIRKFSRLRFEIEDLVNMGTLSAEMAEFMQICVQQRRNILVSGGTGCGKTTTLNVLSNFIPSSERIVTIEDAAELQLHQEHLVRLESRPANIEGRGQVTIRDLVRNSLRMRPDRIVVGECRGGEALDMLQAMNTGHDGSLTTGHANSPRDLLSRLEVMVLMSGMDLPVRAIREQISSAVDVIVHQTRFSDGKRRVTSIVEVDGMEGDTILLQKIFEHKQSGRGPDGEVIGEFTGCGYAPSFYAGLEASGVAIDRSIFGEPDGLPEARAPHWEHANVR